MILTKSQTSKGEVNKGCAYYTPIIDCGYTEYRVLIYIGRQIKMCFQVNYVERLRT